ncbi:MAG TPA: BON domain-containing protein, partial [Candidatus Binatia bacterium]|nr:BON domain-containing protein [Candidatus Binatia bacterium]
RASDLPAQVFEPSALERIALYSRGNPRRINALCDRALQISDDGSSGAVTLELIEGVAKDLDLRVAELGGSRSSRKSLGAAAEKYDPSQFQIGEIDTTAVVGETFLEYNRAYDRDRWLSSRGHAAGWVRALVVVVFVVGTGAWLRTDSARNLILGGREALSAILHARQQSAAESTAVFAKPIPALGSAAMEPNRADAAATAENQEGDAPPTAQTDTNAEAPLSDAAETFAAGEADPPPKPAAKPTQAHHRAARHSAPQRHENLQAQVMQAIENRAIIGVAVSVVQGTAFLDGQVATERQRRAAERAARSVTGVERVRNRIAVNLG